MGRMNLGKLFIGGIVAGLVVNVGEFIYNGLLAADAWADAMMAVGLDGYRSGAMAVFVVMAFLMGIAMVWLYAAIRPRFGPGPVTAIYAGLAFWVIGGFFPYLGMQMMGLWPGNLLGWGLVWTLFEFPIATLVGAAVYNEDGGEMAGIGTSPAAPPPPPPPPPSEPGTGDTGSLG
jgi:hypothetical protein